jgi:hypothetical protein
MGPTSESQSRCFFLKKAAQCRRLAAELVGDPTGDALIKIAERRISRASAKREGDDGFRDNNDT